jgi:putative oxidoreductase
MTNATLSVPSRSTTIILWVLRVLMAALFILSGGAKLVGAPMTIHEFEQIGLGQWFRYFTGLWEVAGGVAVLIPAYSGLAAICLVFVDIGAFIAQVTVLHQDWIHPIVIGAILAALIYLQRDSIRARLNM